MTASALFVFWNYSRSVPKAKKKKVGFVVSIFCDDELEAKRVKEDFVLTLHRLIKAGRTGSTFDFIEIQRFHAENIVGSDDAERLRVQTRAHFLLYGRVRRRSMNGKGHHFIELDGLVVHKPIPENVSQRLAGEFSELLPRKIFFETENDLLAFNFASEWTEVVAKYIIGLSAALSGDHIYAEELYTDALSKAVNFSNNVPAFEKLRQRLPIRIFEVFETRASYHYEKWVSTHDLNEIERMWGELQKIDYRKYQRYSAFSLNSICCFLREKDVGSSLDWLHRCPKKSRNSGWYFNHAFLLAYQGDLRLATRSYREAINRQPMIGEFISRVEDFILYVATTDSDKYQLFYCLGLFNWKVKGDNKQAKNDFEKFLHSGSSSDYEKERALTREWLRDIDSEFVNT